MKYSPLKVIKTHSEIALVSLLFIVSLFLSPRETSITSIILWSFESSKWSNYKILQTFQKAEDKTRNQSSLYKNNHLAKDRTELCGEVLKIFMFLGTLVYLLPKNRDDPRISSSASILSKKVSLPWTLFSY